MSSAVLIGGLGVVALILMLLFFKLSDDPDKKHFFLQVLFLGFIVMVIVLIGKASYDEKDHCSWLVANSTTSGSTTSYSYDYTCETNTQTTASLFYRLTTWIMYITIVYIGLYYAYETFMFVAFRKKGGGQ